MIINEINPGKKISYSTNGTWLVLGDELMFNLAKYQRDQIVQIDICTNRDGMLVVSVDEGLYYTAQIEIPPIEYTTPANTDDGTGAPPKALPLNMDKVTLTLWSIENIGGI